MSEVHTFYWARIYQVKWKEQECRIYSYQTIDLFLRRNEYACRFNWQNRSR